MDIVILKGFFLRYLLLPLIALVLCMVLLYIRKKIPVVKIKVLILYILISSLCLAIPGFLGFTGNMFNPYWYLFSMIIYLFLGILNVNLLHVYFRGHHKPLWFSILFEVLITITCMLLGAYLFYLAFKLMSPYQGYALMAATSISIFIVPLSYYYCYLQFINIPFDIYKTWQHSLGKDTVDFEKIKFKSLLVLNLELTKRIEEGKRHSINAKAPSDGASFGDWFYRVVDDYNYKNPNSTIYLFDENHEPHSWIFYTKKSIFHFRKFIDFDKTISENKIADNTTIFCKRVLHHEMENQ